MRRSVLRTTVILVAILAVCGFGNAQEKKARPTTTHAIQPTVSAETIFKNVAPSVVVLHTMKFGKAHSSASGIVLTADGYIATNYHAIAGADAVELKLFSGVNTYIAIGDAKLYYADRNQDIAILKIDSSGLLHLDASVRSTQPAIGEKVFAIGNPRGMDSTISEGIVSGLRVIDGQTVIQHTAPISPGSSGGALVDSKGILLGINSWQVTDAQNINFAVPAGNLRAALLDARNAKQELPFPKGEDTDSSSFAVLALKALTAGDYIQAINQAEQAVAAGVSDSEIYAVLGVSNFELGKRDAATQYLNQTILLSGADDLYKQTARLYLIRQLTADFQANPDSVDRLTFLKLVNDFLGSKSSSIVEDNYYRQMRDWVATVPDILRSISGTWRDEADTSEGSLAGVLIGNEYAISGDGAVLNFTLKSRSRPSSSVSLSLFGTLSKGSDSVYTGSLQRTLMPLGGVSGIARQTVRVQFRVSDALNRLEGTADYGAVETAGDAGSFLGSLLKRGHYICVLRRTSQ